MSHKRRVFAILVAAALAAGGSVAGPASAARPARPTDPVAHDPTMASEGPYYYVIITGDAQHPNTYLPIKRSTDLVHWTEMGPVFTALPSWVSEQLGTTPADAWAPKLVRTGGQWALYYAVSQFGTQNSVIGLATSPTLDPTSPAYKWTDQGMVIRSTAGVDDFNAIDPDYVTDRAGGAWLAFGSFWGGIKMRRLDPATGKLATSDTTLYSLATRVVPDAEEGPAIVRHGAYYYLFLSFDFCCRGVQSDYRTVVGRSSAITGPYLDRDGLPLIGSGGTEVLRGYNEFVGTGGADIYSAGRTTYLVNHYYDATDGGTPRLNVRPVSWEDGWPVVGDPVNPSRSVGHGDAYVRLVERTSGQPVVDVGCGYEGADLALGAYRPGDLCQQWQYGYRGNGTSSLLNRFSNKIAEVAACNNVDGGRVAQWGWLGFLPNNDCQRWQAAPTADGWTRLRSVLPGTRVIDVSRCAGGTGDTLVVNTQNDASCQEFRFEPVGPVLLVDQDATPSGRSHRQWVFTPAGGAEYTISDARTGHRLGRGVHTHWTLVPRTDGAWTLALVGTSLTRTVRLLIP
jgi:hypothetical protein